ncbi:QueT transporter family protein [Bacillus niameyensis]|uniref:QueT transporter family protein n=1 Tax=Bacillus niameyensis TaxID=1522308 RepID=UPI000781D20F|nr:QueT transporter family protein [Bacillus niameyensis]
MSRTTLETSSRIKSQELVKAALVTALYVVVTFLLSVISFGPLQLRLAEMFNYLALYHKRYVFAVTLGVVIANFMSPTWILDVPIGATATFLALILCRALTKRIKNDILKITITAIVFAISMFSIAFQFHVLLNFPFFYTWFTMAVGELFSMTVGGIIIHFVSKKFDLTK